MNVARRVYLYAIALVALGVLVTGLAGLLQVGLETIVERLMPPVVAVGRDDLRGRVSFSGALAATGLVVWSIHWWLVDRVVRRGGEAGAVERGAALRRLYLYAVLLIGGLVLTFAVRGIVADLLALLFGQLRSAEVVAGRIVEPLSLAVTIGALWAYHARVAALDRVVAPEVGASATLRRWFVYALAFVALMLLLFGAAGLIRAIWESLVSAPEAVELGRAGIALEAVGRLGSIVAGLVVWLLAWRWSAAWLARSDGSDPEVRSVLRKVYLYVILAVAVTWTVWDAGQILYGLLRVALLSAGPAGGPSGVLRRLADPSAAALIFGVAWLYHARVVRREAALAGERRDQAAIRWLYEYLVALVALATFAVGLGGTLETLLDLLGQPGALRPSDWWQDRISLFSTLVVVGLPLWLFHWRRLQREASTPLARGSVVRRIYLLVAFAGAVLTLLFSGAFALYQLIRVGLGEHWTAAETSDLLRAVSAAAVAAVLLVYHLGIFRRDAAGTPAPAPPAAGEPILAVAIVRAADLDAYHAFERAIVGRSAPGVEVDLLPTTPAAAARIRTLVEESEDAGPPA